MTSSVGRCRLCLVSTSQKNLVSITGKQLSSLIEDLLRLTFLPEHDLVCVSCCKKIEWYREFLKMCQESEKVLMEERLREGNSNKKMVRQKSLVEQVEVVNESGSKVVTKTRNGPKRSLNTEVEETVLHSRPSNSSKRRKNEEPKRTRAQNVKEVVPLVKNPQKNTVSDIQTPSEPIPNVASTPTFQCNKCHDTPKFQTKIALDLHMRQHTQNMSERCAHCFETFKTPYELKLHTKIHVNSIVGGMKAKFQETFNENQAKS